ncbi:hypothetical protein [Mesoaciditoga lauensis]|uniref:hypothetical protein n=1 Tax=Mesoaciditoga lauensis TaxID=1495039 RepID=UPI00056C559F|nr:hypothetical protein [Mesoaciditoga lauensis]
MNLIRELNLDNPILYYKLDPGEMGIATPSSAMLSISRVAGHETGNAVRARADAIANGGYVIYSVITLDMRKRGAFLAAVAGKTTVEIYYPHGKNGEKGVKPTGEGNKTSTSAFQSVEMKLKNALRTLKNMLKSTKDLAIKEEIQKRISQIENALNMLKMGKIPLENVESLVNVYA